MGAQGVLGQQYDGPDEQNELLRWSWPAVGFAQMSKMSFPSAVALNMPICAKCGHDAPNGCPKLSWATIGRPK